MEQFTTSWHSPSLNKEMPIAVYGHYGFALLLIPTAAADYLEYERFGLIESIKPFIEGGKLKVFSVDSINNESWLNDGMQPQHKVWRHMQWNDYIFNEVVPFIHNSTSRETPIVVCGASFGALHSANLFFKRPDLFSGCLAMSGIYDLTEYTKGFYNDDVYFNSPMHYVRKLDPDGHLMQQIKRSSHIHIATGSGPYEDPEGSRRFAGMLYEKSIWYELDVWGEEWSHDWPTWRAMLPHYLGTRF